MYQQVCSWEFTQGEKENIHLQTCVWEFVILHKMKITQVFFRWSVYKQVVQTNNRVCSGIYDTETQVRLQGRDELSSC